MSSCLVVLQMSTTPLYTVEPPLVPSHSNSNDHLPMHIQLYHHHHRPSQSSQVQVQNLHQWLEEETLPAQFAVDNITMCARGVLTVRGSIK